MRKLLTTALAILLVGAIATAAQDQPKYTAAEYSAYQGCANEKNAQQRVKCLDGFVAQFPQSSLLVYVYELYYKTYSELRNLPKLVEYADKRLELAQDDVIAAYARTYAFANSRVPEQESALAKAATVAEQGLHYLEAWKPEGLTEEQLAAQKKTMSSTLVYGAGLAYFHKGQAVTRELDRISKQPDATDTQKAELKGRATESYVKALEYLKRSIENDPNFALSFYYAGVAHLQKDPPDVMDGFWSVARAIALRIPSEAQIRTYLRNQVLRYQGTICEAEVDRQVDELVSLARSTAERPLDYRIASADDLARTRENAGAFLEDLKAGGDHARLVWLSVCGLEFPDVAVKVIEVANNGESTLLKVFRAPTPEEMEAATEANMEVTVKEQPEAKRLTKDSYVRFTGTLSGYQPEPFLLSWRDARVNAEDIPAEASQPAKRPTKRPGKRPGASKGK